MDELLDVLIESGGKMTFNIGINSIVFFMFIFFTSGSKGNLP